MAKGGVRLSAARAAATPPSRHAWLAAGLGLPAMAV